MLLKYICKHSGKILVDTPDHLLNEVAKQAIASEWKIFSPYIYNLPINKIKILSTENLANIVIKNPGSFTYIPFSKQEDVLLMIKQKNPEFFNCKTLRSLFNIMEGYLFNQIFENIPLYFPLNKNKRYFHKFYVHVEHNPSDMGIGGGSYGDELSNPVVWDMKLFMDYTNLDVKYKQRVEIKGYGLVTNKFAYLESRHLHSFGNVVDVNE
jgi:hypothetical protein